MPSTCTASFVINFSLGLNAEITLGAVTTMLRPGFSTIYYWTVSFTYKTGDPSATGFGFESTDMLSGTFTPKSPIIGSDPSEVQSGILEGTVGPIVIPPGESVTYSGTIWIFQE